MRNDYSRLRTNSKKTAMTRKKLSAPMRYLLDSGFFPRGSANQNKEFLDYGCGKGFDADFCGFAKYDPHFFPDKMLIQSKSWDIVVCNYVLNTLPTMTDVHSVIWDIQNTLVDDGVAYISIRNDKKNLNGETKIGTWQGFTPLNLPVVHKTSSYIIYKLTKNDNLGVILQWK